MSFSRFVIFSRPGVFKRDLSEFWFFFSYGVIYKRQGRKIRPLSWQNTLRKREFAQKKSIYSQYFALNSQCKACSFSVCDRMKHTFSLCRVSWKKKLGIDVWPRKVDQFAVVTARTTLGTWSIITSRVEGTKVLIYSSHVCGSGRMLAGLA